MAAVPESKTRTKQAPGLLWMLMFLGGEKDDDDDSIDVIAL